MKTIFKLFLIVGIIVYLCFAFTQFTQRGNQTICRKVNFTIADSSQAGFITATEADNLLRKSGLYPVGQQMKQIDGQRIEKVLRSNPFIDSVTCYKAPNGELNVLIMQRLPLMRILADNGDNYYIDEKGNTMNQQGYVADLVVATGNISRDYARKHLVELGTFIHDNEFWNNQIEQINVGTDHKLKLVPRVGGHIISFGAPDSIPRKFLNLHTFYKKVMPEVGWNKYSEISVEHVTQVVATKKKKA